MLLQLEELKTFVALAEIKNFTKTAEKLLMSQPTVSLHIKNLEKEFETELFHRSPKFLKITESGELLLERAKKIIHIYEHTKQDIVDLHETIKGTIKIGASYTIGEYVLPSLLRDLQQNYNGLLLEITFGNTNEIIEGVKQFVLDIGLIEGQTEEKDLIVVPFMEDELAIVAGNCHSLASKGIVTIADLNDQAWVIREKGSGTRELLLSMLKANNLNVNSMLTIGSNQGVKEAVVNGLGLSLLSNLVVQRVLEHQYLQTVQVENLYFKRNFCYICSPSRKEKQNVKALISALEQNWSK